MTELDKYHIPEDRNDVTLHLVPRRRISEARPLVPLIRLHGVDRDDSTYFKTFTTDEVSSFTDCI